MEWKNVSWFVEKHPGTRKALNADMLKVEPEPAQRGAYVPAHRAGVGLQQGSLSCSDKQCYAGIGPEHQIFLKMVKNGKKAYK